jgi:hypothetical protein
MNEYFTIMLFDITTILVDFFQESYSSPIQAQNLVA